jgi:hypothetical protein
VRSAPLEYGYYGAWDTTQVSETADHVTYVWVMAGDVGIAQMQEAIARGVTRVVVDVSWLVYAPAAQNKRTLNENARANLRAYFTQLRDLGLLQNIVAIYPMDEPDVNGVSAQDVFTTNGSIRTVEAEFAIGAPLMVIYGVNGTPGIETYDIVGVDAYGDPNTVLQRIDQTVLPTQKKLLVPGGACPWFNNVQPFLDKAQSDASVWGIVAFIWPDQWGGTSNCGIRSAPTRKAYCEAGKHIKGKDNPCPA